MSPNEWSDDRLAELARDVKGLYASYGALMSNQARLDERADVGERERREAREAQAEFAREFRAMLERFDQACDVKIAKLEKTIGTTRWGPAAKAAPYAAAIAAVGAFVTALVKG